MNITTRTSLVIALVFVAAFKLSGAVYDNRIMHMIHVFEESIEEALEHGFDTREQLDGVRRLARAFRATREVLRRFVRQLKQSVTRIVDIGMDAGWPSACTVVTGLWNRKSKKLGPQFIAP